VIQSRLRMNDDKECSGIDSSFIDFLQNVIVAAISSIFLLNSTSAVSGSPISGDGLLPINQENSLGAKAIVWRSNGHLVYLGAALKPVKEIELASTVNTILPYRNGLLVIGEPDNKKAEIVNQVMDIDLDGNVRNVWPANSFMFWSVAYENGKYLATTDTGELFLLERGEGYKSIGKYPDMSIYISAPYSGGIICTSANLTKADYFPAKCVGNGTEKWATTGEWRDVLIPYLCGGYLVEATGSWADAKVKQILVRDINTGKEVGKQSLHRLEKAGCADGKVLYIDDKIRVARLPKLETLKSSSCGGPKPISATLVGETVVCLDKAGKLHSD
jgi:hypothetical protein